VLGERELVDLEEEPEDCGSSTSMVSVPSTEVSIATTGIGCEAATLKLSGWGRALPVLKPGGGVTRSEGGGVIFTVGEVGRATVRLPLRTELLFPPLRQETAESDLDGEELLFALLVLLPLVGNGLPSGVPPLMTVV